ncbi:MAG: DUF3365 domain-containing protein [Bacteroidales bacterium]
MNKRILYSPVILLLAFVVNIGCQNDGYKISEPTKLENEMIVTAGNQISMDLVKSLKSELKIAIQEGGLSEAINVCSLKAIPLTKVIAEHADAENISIKRTSNKYRNPVNAPEKPETLALKHFEDLSASGKNLPEYYTQKITKDGITYYNYYKPMKLEAVCLTCHGDATTIVPEVRNQIAELYPEDKAVNYKEGDFRGLIRITFPE